MDTQSTSITSLHLRKKLELFLSYWKIILVSLLIAGSIAFIYLRYASYKYSAKVTLKIKDDDQSKKIQGIPGIAGGGGLFSDGTDKIKDEISVMTSRTLVENVVKTLNLNIRCFEQGSIIEKELYKNPPLKLSFFASDSIIYEVDTTLYLKIKSPTQFLMFKEDVSSFKTREDSEGKLYAFGDKINTQFGGMVITPNIDQYSPKVGSNLKVSIKPVRQMVTGYQQSISVSTVEGSSIVRLELNQGNADKAKDILNELVIEYNKDVLLDKENIIQVTSDFINNRLAIVSDELEQVESSAEETQKRGKLTALGSQTDIYLQSERNNEAQIVQTTNKLQLLDFFEAEVNADDKASDLLPLNVIDDPNVTQSTKIFNELVAERDKLLKNSTDKNPVVVRLNDEIKAQKMSLQNTVKNMKESNQITLSTLNKEDARLRGRIYSAPTRNRTSRKIERQQSIKESLYLYLLEKREESSIRLGMYTANAKIIDSAYSSYMPVAPNKMFTYLAAILLGLAIPMGFIYANDLLDTKIYNKEDLVDILDIPYLGDVPRTSKKTTLIKKIDYSPKAEAFRIIRSNIDFMLKSNNDTSKKIFITSTKSQEGKSHTSTNLASSISFSKKSVLLIEMDIRVPKILSYLGIEGEGKKGLSDYIVDKKLKPQDIVVKHKDNAYLDIIASGTIPPNPSELLISDRIGQLFAYFDSKYDYIVVDTSAVGIVSDTLLVANYADMFVYVVSADNVDQRQLVDVAQTLYDKKRLPQMTLLLNGIKKGKGGYGYGYGYGNAPNQKKKKWYQFS